jgi:hypothetical protein
VASRRVIIAAINAIAPAKSMFGFFFATRSDNHLKIDNTAARPPGTGPARLAAVRTASKMPCRALKTTSWIIELERPHRMEPPRKKIIQAR